VSEKSRHFADLPISQPVVDALRARGIELMFPIQQLTLPDALAGRDILAHAPTGSGKTFAFAIPIVERLDPSADTPAAVVLVPTRELCSQVVEEFEVLLANSPLRVAPVYGGTKVHQQAIDAAQAHIVVATPGRLNDISQRNLIDLSRVQILVLDEADRMLDMGFQPQTDRIVSKLPRDRHTMFFSATLEGRVGRVARSYTHEPLKFEVTRDEDELAGIEHRFIKVGRGTKFGTLTELLDEDRNRDGLTLIFVRTKRGADQLTRDLNRAEIPAAAMHGDMPQAVREKTLRKFDEGKLKMLVATDVAARGLDLDDITHVIQFDPPDERADYVHRAGRTGRAGRSGICTTLIMDDQQYVMGRVAEDLGLQDAFTAAGLKIMPPRMAYVSKSRHAPRLGAPRPTHRRPGPRR
jgi:ATP-dependent RNA helicase RhlE